MKIVGGKFKGMKIKSCQAKGLRPMTSMMREAMFDICSEDVVDAKVLDLFSGSGSIGFEAISRGAKRVSFVEKNKMMIKIIDENAKNFDVKNLINVHCSDVFRFVEYLGRKKETFDIIFIDPPYYSEQIVHGERGSCYFHILKCLDRLRLLSKCGSIFIERSCIIDDNVELQLLKNDWRRKYGKSQLEKYSIAEGIC